MDNNIDQPNDRPHGGKRFSNIEIHGENNRNHLGDVHTTNDSSVHHNYHGVTNIYHRSNNRPLPENSQPGAENEKKPAKKPCLIPFSRNEKFQGRQNELKELQESILKENGPKRIALAGLGGAGKTQIALEFAYLMQKKEYFVFWIPCMSLESVEQAYMSIAQKFALPDTNPTNVKTRVKTHLSETEDKWLLIYDNADDIDMWISKKGTALKSFLPRSDNGHILFTTRNQKLAVKLVSSNVISVSEMDHNTARSILQEYLIRKDLVDDHTTTTSLLEKLTFLPLAITQAAAYVNENSINLSEYLALLQEKGQEQDVIQLLSEDFEDDHRYEDVQNPVATTWLISFNQIQQLNSLAIDYLSFMACISHRGISKSLLPPATSDKEMTEALGLLKAYSFISAQEDRSFNLHRLVHLATRSWLKQNDLLKRWTSNTANRFDEICPNFDNTNRNLWREYLPHALYMIERMETQHEKCEYRKLIMRVGIYLFRDGMDSKAMVIFADMSEIYQQVFGVEAEETILVMAPLAMTYLHQGQLTKSEQLNEQTLNISKRVLGIDHSTTLNIMSVLASTYQHQGRLKEAEELGLQVLEIKKQTFGITHPDTLISMGDLASEYLGQGRLKEAEELRLQVLGIKKQTLGIMHPDTLISMSDLALVYLGQGRLKEAEELELQVLEIKKQTLGIRHPDTLISMGDLALVYHRQGRLKEAEELGLQVLGIKKQTFEMTHPDTLISMSDLALRQGRLKEAEELGLQVLGIKKQTFGITHLHTLISMSDLALVYHEQGRLKEAEELQLQVLDARKQVLGTTHPNTLISMISLASVYRGQGRLKKQKS
ncbi:hypothetical protein BGW36DRAFT_335315 [Talaromyces proteolyticus]|uniref:NB-ARC domain-containing protein n=1 Tax=Talaromyces proteolyticus TaxID=1131652 RepID=A0AAD4KYZ6_9EURO|nr:uncharacterized protein BGW36DRAFT_335315 [Talaromyces proteolyticus]KAH8704126.1 hypothetical protein BGW36DRAFT_335315 [Talaromyces proteolyticus]